MYSEGKEGKKRKKERKSENINIKRKKVGKRPHKTMPYLFFYDDKLTGIWALSKIKKKKNVIYIVNQKKSSKNEPVLLRIKKNLSFAPGRAQTLQIRQKRGKKNQRSN